MSAESTRQAADALQQIYRRRARRAAGYLRREAAALRRSPIPEDRAEAAETEAAAEAMSRETA